MTAQAQPMIYEKEATAKTIKSKVEKRTGQDHHIVKLPTGWQVAPVQKVAAKTPSPAAKAETKKTTASLVKVTLPFKGESKSYLNVEHGGTVRYIGKATAVSWMVDTEAGMIALTLPKTFAKKRGFDWEPLADAEEG